MAMPTVGAGHGDSPIRAEVTTPGPAWAAFRVASTGILVMEAEFHGELPAVARFDVNRADGSLLGSMETVIQQGGIRTMAVAGETRWEGEIPLDASSWTSGLRGCVPLAYGARDFGGPIVVGAGFDLGCATAGPVIAIAFVAGENVDASAIRLRSVEPADVQEVRTGTDVTFAQLDDFRADVALEASDLPGSLFFVTGARVASDGAFEMSARHELVGSFGAFQRDATDLETTRRDEGGSLTFPCPCRMNADGSPGSDWTFRVHGAGTNGWAPLYLAAADVDVPWS